MFNFSLRYLPGDIFLNAFASAASEILGPILGSFIYKFSRVNISLILTFSIATFGSLCIIVFGAQNTFYMPFMCLAARTGVCAAFNIVYTGHKDVFTI
jgi:hypothetical protein